MSDIPVNPEPILPTTGEGVAERFLERELVESRASLRRTQIVGAIVTVLMVGSVAWLTSGWRSNLEPNAAAEITTGLASQRLDDLTPKFAEYIHEEVPKAIRTAPDELIKRMPEYRTQLENRVESDFRARSAEGAKRLHDELTAYLTQNKDQVGQMLKAGNDPASAATVTQGLEDAFRKFLQEEKVGDTTIQEKLDETLKTLTLVEKRTERLAANQGLTPSEAKARHAVAMLMKRIDAAQASSTPIALPTIDPNAVKDTVNQAVEGMRDKATATVDDAKAMLPANGGDAAATEPTTATPPPAAKPAPLKTATASPKKPGASPTKP